MAKIKRWVVVKSHPGTALIIGTTPEYAYSGKLLAQGTSEKPIVFTTINETQPRPGQWSGITFQDYASDESILDFCTVAYGRSINLFHASPMISNCNIHDMQYQGLFLNGSSKPAIVGNTFSELPNAIRFDSSVETNESPIISGNTFTRCTGYAIDINPNSKPIITNNTFTNNTAYLISLYPDQIGNVFENSFSGNNPNAMRIFGGILSRDATWLETGAGYFIESTLTVAGTGGNLTTLTLNPGVILLFNASAYLIIGSPSGGAITGKLLANEVTFTSSDTDQPTAGAWGSLLFYRYSSGESQLDNCTMEYGRSIELYGASPRIRNCLIHDMEYQGIFLSGSASPSIEGNSFSNSPRAIAFDSSVETNANPVISGNTFTGCTNYAIDVNPYSTPTIANNTFRNNTAYLISLYPDQVGNVSGNTFSGNNPNMMRIQTGTVTKDASWTETGVGYYVEGTLTVAGSGGKLATLTLSPGVAILLGSGQYLIVGSSTGRGIIGKLTAHGVTFTTSIIDQPYPGAWGSILFYNNSSNESTLDSCTIQYGQSILVFGVSPTISNCNIHDMQYQGVYLRGNASPSILGNKLTDLPRAIVFDGSPETNGIPIISGNTFTRCKETAIDANSASSPLITNNSFTSNTSYLISLYPNQVGNVSGNTFSGNNVNMLRIYSGIVSRDARWSEIEVGFFMAGTVRVEGLGGSMAMLTLISGLKLYFGSGAGIEIGSFTGNQVTGKLLADGVTFTTVDRSQPEPGKWSSILFRANASDESLVTNCTIEYATIGIYLSGAAARIESNTIKYCSRYGVYCDNAFPQIMYNEIILNETGVYSVSSAKPIINFNNISGNSIYGVRNTDATVTLNGRYNWWGDPTGPSGMGSGLGDAVSNYVNYSAWLQQPNTTHPPHPFSLLSPEDADTVRTASLRFVWEATTDPDPGDIVSYTLYLAKTSSFTSPDSVAGLSDTTFTWTDLQAGQRYYWKVKAVDTNTDGAWSSEAFTFTVDATVAVDGPHSQAVPLRFWLSQNYPNPFNPSTTISYTLPHSTHVRLIVYNSLGEEVENLIDENQGAGSHSIEWSAHERSSGVYYLKIQARDFTDVKKALLLK